MRLLTGLPALLLLAILSMAAALPWIVAAIAVLVSERVPAAIADSIAMKLRYHFRVVAYHLSLVDAYPSISELPLAGTPRSYSIKRRPPRPSRAARAACSRARRFAAMAPAVSSMALR